MVLSGQENGVTPLVLAKGIVNTALGSGNATNNNMDSAWASVPGNMGSGWANGLANMRLGWGNGLANMRLGWANGLANMGSGLARETTSLVWENGTNSSMGLVLAKGTSMVMIGENE